MKILKEYIHLLLEKSYTEEDVPPFFYVVGRWDQAENTLSQGYLEGIEGISDSKEIIYHWLFVRDMIVKMPGEAFVQQNRVSKIQYDNPHYLVSKDFAALRRLYGESRDKIGKFDGGFFVKMDDKIQKAEREIIQGRFLLISAALRWNGTREIEKAYEEQKPVFKSANQFGAWIWKNLDNFDHRWQQIKKEYSQKEVEQIFTRAIQIMGQQYSDEREWSIKDKKIQIPQGSTIYIKLGTYINRYKQSKIHRAEQYRMWEKEGKPLPKNKKYWLDPDPKDVLSGYGLEGYEKELEKIQKGKQLQEKYKIVFIDSDKYESAKDKQVMKRYS